MRAGVDYSWARPDPAGLAAAGYTFAARYASLDVRVNGGRTKLLDRAEALALAAAGLDVVLVWEGRAADRDPLRGAAQGIVDATEAARQAATVGTPAAAGIYFAVDWDVPAADLPKLAPYFVAAGAVLGGPGMVGVYGSHRVVRWLLDQRLVGLAWQTYAWSSGLWDVRAQLRQVRNGQTVAGGQVDLDEAHADTFGQWRPTVTTAPADLLSVRAYLRARTGLPIVSLGITGDLDHKGGYHHGVPDVAADDYSVRESPRDAHPTSSASALDLGGAFGRFREITLGLVAACVRKDPRARDIREVIYTDNGTTVKRWDRLGIRSTGGLSHLTHTHLSLHRDSEGRRDRDDNLLGLLRELFDGKPGTRQRIPDMLMGRTVDNPTVYLGDGFTRCRKVPNVALMSTLQAAGVPFLPKFATEADLFAALCPDAADAPATPVALTDVQVDRLGETITGRIAELLHALPQGGAVDPAALVAALKTDPGYLAAVAGAVNDDAAERAVE